MLRSPAQCAVVVVVAAVVVVVVVVAVVVVVVDALVVFSKFPQLMLQSTKFDLAKYA